MNQITLEQLEKAPERYLAIERMPCYIKVGKKYKAVLLYEEEFKRLKKLSRFQSLFENVLFLSSNQSLRFLEKEPDLYENY